ncbi:MAG: MerR family transcriptional regulator [Actinomycetia bacterium]|nr:MerR family transcriptional regulator [Actinomycetes bacterium]
MVIQQGMSIGELAQKTGLSPRTLRYYEECGLVAPAARSGGGRRLYAPDVLDRLRRIRELQDLLGFSLEEIRQVIAAEERVRELRARYHREEDAASRRQVLEEAIALAEALLALVDRRRAGLEAMRADLGERLARYRRLLRELEERGE